jgi:malate dehydrogenase (oxaloacetate-decarboxylating)(NADP+)
MAAQGTTLLHDSTTNESTAFTQQERDDHGLTGLLPPAVETLDTQVKRCLLQLSKKPNDIERYIYLSQLADDNQTLFFKVLSTDPVRFLPIVYDPTVGTACFEFGHIYRKPNGIYLSIEQRGKVKEVLSHWPIKDVRFICVSTGGRILGLGDLGANGMGIPIGKLQLYTACAAVPPEGLLPLLLDCGTDNEKLLADPLYLGFRHKRSSPTDLDSFVGEFVQAVQDLYPKCCIHFEDWKGTDALRLLAKYTDKVCCYNDDIQGTGSVAVAGLYSALKITKGQLKDQRILFFGGGSAALGMGNMIVAAMKLERVTEKDARDRISLFDVNGLIESSRKDLSPDQKLYAHPHAPTKSLLDAINAIKPTILIGVSTVGKTFTKEVVEAMTKLNPRPVIFALSNPTEHAECTAEEAYTWSGGKAVFAAGVQFAPVKLNDKTYLPAQVNNFYIFPAVCLAVYATQAKRVPNELFIEAAKGSADQVSPEDLEQGMLFPPQKDILKIEVQTAIVVAKKIFDLGLARVEKPADIFAWIHSLLYKPEYVHEIK